MLEDLVDEVKMARDLGVDGFCFDILSTDGRGWNQLLKMLEAVNIVGGDFKIVLMPDMEAQLKEHPEYFVPAICMIADNPALYHLDDGRLVIAPFDAHLNVAISTLVGRNRGYFLNKIAKSACRKEHIIRRKKHHDLAAREDIICEEA